MSNSNWRGLLKILEIKHWRYGEVIWEKKNLNNLLHMQGEKFVLEAVFTGGQTNTIIPAEFYLGLDDRSSVAATDTMTNVFLEPVGFGYERQPVSSNGDFTVTEQVSGHYMAVGPLITYEALSGSWGPVQNVFLTDQPDNSGHLISTVPLGEVVTVNDGDTLTLRISMALVDCPPSTNTGTGTSTSTTTTAGTTTSIPVLTGQSMTRLALRRPGSERGVR